jgi:site-specific DNA-methyltransferase (adenine-specific)
MIDLRLGDCLDILPTLADKSVDAVITDPPYGVDYTYASHIDTADNLLILVLPLLENSKRIAKRTAIFTGVKNYDFYRGADWTYAWVCPAGTGVSAYGFTCWTPIAFYGKDAYSGKGSRPDVFVDKNPKRTGVDHPCEKPLSVMLWAIERFTRPGEIVLDPFMGSGTTGVACVKLGRNFIGIEKEPKYYDIAARRIHEAQQQMVMPL